MRTKTTRIPYDESNKLLFSEPKMVEDLLRGFFDESWIKDLDFTSLKRVNSSLLSSRKIPQNRHADVIWKISWKGRWLYLLILLEFQSTVD